MLHADIVCVCAAQVDSGRFRPPSLAERRVALERSGGRVVVVVVSRLVLRKGTDLLARVIPKVCAAHPQVQWRGGGGGCRAAASLLLRKQGGRGGLLP